MSDTPYSNREIDGKLDLLRAEQSTAHELMMSKLDEVAKTTLSTLTQATKTNGRVNRLEKIMLVVVTAIIVILTIKFPEVAKLLTIFI